VQGWAPDFIPKLAEDAIAQKLIDRVVPVSGARALELARRLATEEGILAGISGGATLAGAIEVCKDLPDGANVLCMLPDTGERYLSTPLFADVPAEMTAEEIELSKSTPGFRFDTPARPSAPAAPPAVPASPILAEERDFVEQALADREQPVVLFALEWCEFCWSVRRLFDRLQIRYRAVDLDSVEYQQDDRGGRIRAALAARTSVVTIPQIFIGGEFIGGCTDLFEAWRGGRAQDLLERSGVDYDRTAKIDPYTFLPGWLHPR
jgi:cysteine synthase A